MENEFRLIGVPGAGKTTALKRRIEKLVLEEGYDADRIIATSFSRAGAREIAGRVNLPEENCATLHGFAFRALGLQEKQVADGSAANLKAWSEAYPLYALSSQSNPTIELQPIGAASKTRGDELMAHYQWLRARLVPREEWSPAVLVFARAWEGWKSENNLVDFTDMIEMCDGSILPHCDWLFVDEAQDMSPLELRLVRDWGRYVERYVLAGDPNQAIYDFKGADGEGFFNPALPPERTHVLKRSWRLPKNVATLAKRWQTYPTPLVPSEEMGAVIYTGIPLGEVHTLDLLGELLAEGKTAMLLTTAGYMLNKLLSELRRRALPFHNPYQPKNGAWNPLNPRRLRALEAWLAGRADLEVIWRLTEHLPANQAFYPNRKTMLKQEAKSRTPAQADWENLTYYFPPSIATALASRDPWKLINLLHLAGEKTRGLRYTLEVIARRGREAAYNPQIIVGTIHSVKGGEADCVFLWPNLSPAARKAWLGGKEGQDAARRAIYVGMTRAREQLYLGRLRGNDEGLDWDLDAPNIGMEEDDVITI